MRPLIPEPEPLRDTTQMSVRTELYFEWSHTSVLNMVLRLSIDLRIRKQRVAVPNKPYGTDGLKVVRGPHVNIPTKLHLSGVMVQL